MSDKINDRVLELALVLESNLIAAAEIRIGDKELNKDGAIYINDWLSIQVGEDYFIVCEETPNLEYIFNRAVSEPDEVIEQIAMLLEADEEYLAACRGRINTKH